MDPLINEIKLLEGYIFTDEDENGNIINATKIVLEKKEKEYPKTYEECNRIMGVELWNTLWGEDSTEYEEQMEDLIDAFIRLKVCRDAYWKSQERRWVWENLGNLIGRIQKKEGIVL